MGMDVGLSWISLVRVGNGSLHGVSTVWGGWEWETP